MINNGIRSNIISKVIFILLILFISASIAQEANLPWLQYQKAAELYKQKAPVTQILSLVQEVQRTSKDSVLVGRSILLLASALDRDHQYEKALLELEKFNQPGQKYLETMQSEAWLRSGIILLKQKNIKSARNYFNKVLEGLNNSFLKDEAVLGLAWISADENNWERCDSLLSLIISTDISDVNDERILILKARQYISSNQYSEAIKLLENSESQSGLYYLASAHELAGNRVRGKKAESGPGQLDNRGVDLVEAEHISGSSPGGYDSHSQSYCPYPKGLSLLPLRMLGKGQ